MAIDLSGGLIERWQRFVDACVEKQKLKRGRQDNHDLTMAGEAVAYCTAARELEAHLSKLGPAVERLVEAGQAVCDGIKVHGGSPKTDVWDEALDAYRKLMEGK